MTCDPPPSYPNRTSLATLPPSLSLSLSLSPRVLRVKRAAPVFPVPRVSRESAGPRGHRALPAIPVPMGQRAPPEAPAPGASLEPRGGEEEPDFLASRADPARGCVFESTGAAGLPLSACARVCEPPAPSPPPQGSTGSRGLPGSPGSTGSKGTRGSEGAQGSPGDPVRVHAPTPGSCVVGRTRMTLHISPTLRDLVASLGGVEIQDPRANWCVASERCIRSLTVWHGSALSERRNQSVCCWPLLAGCSWPGRISWLPGGSG